MLNGSNQVTPALRERVIASAERLQYSPHGPAQAVARGTSTVVALVIGDIADPYFASIAAGVTDEADRRGLAVTIATTGADAAREATVIATLRAQRLRALVISSSRMTASASSTSAYGHMLEIARMGAGVGYLGGESSPAPQACSPSLRMLRVANRTGSEALADELVGVGYRSFAVLTGPPDLMTSTERADGFTAALARAGLPEPVRLAAPLTRAGGYEATRALLGVGQRPECVFAVTDMMAVGAMAALREAGWQPGTDVAVAGFDDIELLQDVAPALTTVALPLPGIGEHMLRLALDGSDPGPVAGVVRLRESPRASPFVADRCAHGRCRPLTGASPVVPARRRERRTETPKHLSASAIMWLLVVL